MNTKARPTNMNTKDPPRNPINLLVEHIQLIITENIKRHMYINYQTPPPLKIPARILGKSLNHWPRKFPKIMMITTTRKSGPGGDVRGQGESSTPKIAGPDGRVLHHKYGVL